MTLQERRAEDARRAMARKAPALRREFWARKQAEAQSDADRAACTLIGALLD